MSLRKTLINVPIKTNDMSINSLKSRDRYRVVFFESVTREFFIRDFIFVISNLLFVTRSACANC